MKPFDVLVKGVPRLWLLYFLLSSIILEEFQAIVSCEFSYGFETEDFTLAVINLSYIDPLSETQRIENGDIGRYATTKIDDVSGVVVHVTSRNRTSHTACDRLDTDNIPHEPYIALIEQGQCANYIKLRHVAEANASAAVVYSSHFDSRLFKVNHKVHGTVCVFISREKGEAIASLVDNGTRVMMHIGLATRSSFRHASINRTSVLFVSISFIVLMVISMAWLVFYYVQRFRYILAKDLLSKRLCSAARTALDKIPVKIIRSNDLDCEGGSECCAVCLESLKPGEFVRVLPCQHRFHRFCVDPWLLEQRSCPMCKLDILIYFGLIYTGSQESVLMMDDDFHRRNSALEEDIFYLPIFRHSSSSQTVPQVEDRATSPCNISYINHNIETGEHSEADIINVNIDTSNHSLEVADNKCETETTVCDDEDDGKDKDIVHIELPPSS